MVAVVCIGANAIFEKHEITLGEFSYVEKFLLQNLDFIIKFGDVWNSFDFCL